jgi:hypothetical protein
MSKYRLVIYVLIICFPIIWSSCKDREVPEEETGTPVFTLKGNAGSSSINIAAGVNNYYMSTDYSIDQYQVYTFKGELRKDNCNDCGPSLKVTLRNYTNQFPFDIEQADLPGEYKYYYGIAPVDSTYRIEFLSTSTGAGTATHAWDFGNGVTSAETHPVATYTAGGIYTITETTSYDSGCTSSLSQPVFLTPTRIGKNIDFNVNPMDTFLLMFNSIPVDHGATITWDFGDTQTGSGAIIPHQYAASGIYKVCVLYIKGADTAQYCRNVNTEDVTSCKSNYRFNTSLSIDSLQLSKVTVEWKAENGVVYSSANIKQPAGSSFKIISAKPYTVNEQGQKTRQLTVEFNCTVSNGTGSIELSNMQAVIAVAFP